MLRSMYSGISGLKNFQTKLDVIGNNIANVNTYGFKKGRVVFKDLFSQQIAGASGSSATRGGINPKSIGLGTQLATIDTIHTPGSTQTTGRALDLALNGDGYFIVGTINDTSEFNPDPSIDTTDGNQLVGESIETDMSINYTRLGNIYFDKDGYLVNGDGMYLIGEAATKAPSGTPWVLSGEPGLIQIPTDAQSYSIGGDGTVSFVDANGTLSVAGQIRLAKFANNSGLEKVGENLYKETTNSGVLDTDDTEGIQLVEMLAPGTNGTATVLSGAVEMSNVDLSEEFAEMIVAQRGFQANTKIITTSDEILQELVNLKR
ncbi:flagellar basal body rod protein FlgG [Bacillus sp. Marseille-P3661]|uniref:flagellar basal body rod protein FlgG n=1 Tax=Bacillus sp. Marseille-P3661 TaxID=1936234 RepID=UPI000C865915|nr:flagellar basal body rod protein FlgG [Bacillus sp. Marseille-P3661]